MFDRVLNKPLAHIHDGADEVNFRGSQEKTLSTRLFCFEGTLVV